MEQVLPNFFDSGGLSWYWLHLVVGDGCGCGGGGGAGCFVEGVRRSGQGVPT